MRVWIAARGSAESLNAANGLSSARVFRASSNATTTTIFQPSTSRSTWSSAPLAATTPWCNTTGTDADGHECWFQNSWAFRTKNESSPSSSSRCNGSTSNGTTNDACNDERSWTNTTTPRRSRSKPSYGSGQSTSCSSRRSRSSTSSSSSCPQTKRTKG